MSRDILDLKQIPSLPGYMVCRHIFICISFHFCATSYSGFCFLCLFRVGAVKVGSTPKISLYVGKVELLILAHIRWCDRALKEKKAGDVCSLISTEGEHASGFDRLSPLTSSIE
ncbi:hypothetical protein O6H91_04G034000 [Diphasiastrum complanatum]|uniref:Uncharacterized protein n=1 Tax=Diphasiastrum complanatum TaxID=34168 RepID=A0ACC2DVP5_DIPCM|nr:hypothetical protein O6H91_04G034000 [Diphasiastrum complanatum]